MADMKAAHQTQMVNIEKRSGKTLAQLTAMLQSSGLAKHGELRDHLKQKLSMGHGDANTFVHHFLNLQNPPTSAAGSEGDDVLATIYVGAKAALRPIHDALIQKISGFGPYEVAPKKGYVSLRRKKQFAMIGPTTTTRVDLGLNMKGVPATARLVELPAGGMCNYRIKLSQAKEVDAEVISWVRRAYDSAA